MEGGRGAQQHAFQTPSPPSKLSSFPMCHLKAACRPCEAWEEGRHSRQMGLQGLMGNPGTVGVGGVLRGDSSSLDGMKKRVVAAVGTESSSTNWIGALGLTWRIHTAGRASSPMTSVELVSCRHSGEVAAGPSLRVSNAAQEAHLMAPHFEVSRGTVFKLGLCGYLVFRMKHFFLCSPNSREGSNHICDQRRP